MRKYFTGVIICSILFAVANGQQPNSTTQTVPYFSTTSVSETEKFLQLLCALATREAENAAKLNNAGEAIDSFERCEHIALLASDHKRRSVTWPVKVLEVTDAGVRIELPAWVSLYERDKPITRVPHLGKKAWSKQLQPGGEVTLNAIVRNCTIKEVKKGKFEYSMQLYETCVVPQEKSPAEKKP